ncbi:hypothetical protein THOM_1833 [Trachipleistophora hominis]|uniref:Uncharacterized protein n=1 Tax=Trachipleistophora hominis TaxID=72359 RepID=L7JV92_TRAHO|nr:hypothetical protein THOM_1833 [Trachipleistophora hominis]
MTTSDHIARESKVTRPRSALSAPGKFIWCVRC